MSGAGDEPLLLETHEAQMLRRFEESLNTIADFERKIIASCGIPSEYIYGIDWWKKA